MATTIDKLIHKVKSSTANLTCILTNGIAYQFVYIDFHEGWICTLYNVREHCYSTRWTFSSCPISCMAIFFCFCIQFCKLQARDLNCLLEIQVPRHWNGLQYISHYDWSSYPSEKSEWKKIFSHNTEPERGGRWGGEGDLYNLQFLHLHIIIDL